MKQWELNRSEIEVGFSGAILIHTGLTTALGLIKSILDPRIILAYELTYPSLS